jgi:hypothetical protein
MPRNLLPDILASLAAISPGKLQGAPKNRFGRMELVESATRENGVVAIQVAIPPS